MRWKGRKERQGCKYGCGRLDLYASPEQRVGASEWVCQFLTVPSEPPCQTTTLVCGLELVCMFVSECAYVS